MIILSSDKTPNGIFVIVEDDGGRSFVYLETYQGYFVFSPEADWLKFEDIHNFVVDQRRASIESSSEYQASQSARSITKDGDSLETGL